MLLYAIRHIPSGKLVGPEIDSELGTVYLSKDQYRTPWTTVNEQVAKCLAGKAHTEVNGVMFVIWGDMDRPNVDELVSEGLENFEVVELGIFNYDK